MPRRGYTGTSTYRSRPRTRIYDSNYSMGEAAYRSAIDDLDRKQFGRVQRQEPVTPPVEERISPVRRSRPLSSADIEANWDGPGPAPRLEEADTGFDDMMERIKTARSRAMQLDQSFESAFTQRREDVKKRFAEKMLDTVGINGEMEERRPRLRELAHVDEPKWPAITENEESASEIAARARARQTRARLADIDNEMAEMEQRGAARERRAAAVRQLLASSDEHADSIRLSKKVTTITTSSY